MTTGQPNSIPSSISPEPLPPPSPLSGPHAPPMDEEAVYYEGSPVFGGEPGKVILFALAGTLALIAPVLIRAFAHQWPQKYLSLGLVILGLILWIIPQFITRSKRYRISNYRIDFEHGMLSKDIKSLELWHVEDLSFHQSLLDRLLGIGAIRVQSHDDNMPDLDMRGLPHARKLFEELKLRVIAVKRQQGVMKLDTGT